jgi:hypothetical protein
MIWEIDIVQPCEPVGWLISRKLMVMLLPPLHPAKIRALWMWRTMTADVQLSLQPRGKVSAMNTDPNGNFMS